ncbi:UGT-62 protein [Aphelenchoides avenae]|nr:UGT-62 protein [Aphelenchus avenae]
MPSSRNVFLLLILALVTTTGHGLKVAIFALDLSGSQLLWNVRVAHTLLKAGHNVTLIRLQTWTYKEATAKIDPRVDQWVVNAVVPGFDFEKLQEQQAEMAFKSESALKMLSAEGRKKWSQFSDIFALGCKEVLKKKDFMEKLKASDFDIAFSHMYDYCAIGLIHYAQTPTWIWLNSASLIDYVARDIGSPMPPSYVPRMFPIIAKWYCLSFITAMLMDASDKMTFFQRVKSFFGYFIVTYFHHHVVAPKETEVFRRVVDPSFPDLRELSRKVPLVMVNSDEFYDLTRPTLHKIINVGGLGMKKTEANPLPDEYAKLVDAASSVVVFTFGSVVNASLMPQEMKEEFMKAFARFPDTQFFFRYPLTDIDHIKPKNVMMAKWLPQNDLLQHPKTRALISHGGYNSLQEAINSGTPIITIPLFGDQFRNGRIAESQGFGYYLDKTNLNENTIAEAIETVLVNERYSTTVKKIQRMVEAKPRKAEESLVKWTEFLAEFKELPNLTPHGVHLRLVMSFLGRATKKKTQ